jgi:hypothetical protein
VWVDRCTGAGVKLTPVLPASGVYLLRVDPVDLETGGATFTVTPALASAFHEAGAWGGLMTQGAL